MSAVAPAPCAAASAPAPAEDVPIRVCVRVRPANELERGKPNLVNIVDDNCIVFDSEEENKFAYTELHEVLPSLVAHLAVQARRVHASLTRLPSPLWGRYSPAAAILHAGGVSA